MMEKSIACMVLCALMSLSSAQAVTVKKEFMPGLNAADEITNDTASEQVETKVEEMLSSEETKAQSAADDVAEKGLFKAFDEQAVSAEPVEMTDTGHKNIVTRLDELTKKRASAVSKSRAVQRAVTYKVRGKRYTTLADSDGFVQTGRASWYGKRFHGRKTASGERFDMNALTAAHKELPLGTKVEVINNENGKRVVVTVNDRGPFHGNRVIDLSRAAASQLGVIRKGTANVTIRAL